MTNADDKMPESQPESKTATDVGAQKPEDADKLDPAFVGFADNGKYFVVKIEVREGYRAILDFLQESADFLKFHVARTQQEMAKRAVIKPTLWTRLRGK